MNDAILSNGGRLESLDRYTLRYFSPSGKTLTIDCEPLVGAYSFAVYLSGPVQWDTPHQNQEINAVETKLIGQAIEEFYNRIGIKIDVVLSDKGEQDSPNIV